MKFSEILGQNRIKEQLTSMVQSNRLSHALLFHGTEGVGKKALALAFAQYIVCENKQEQDACGVCPSCKKAEKLVHPDIHFVFPVIKDGSKNLLVIHILLTGEKNFFTILTFPTNNGTMP